MQKRLHLLILHSFLFLGYLSYGQVTYYDANPDYSTTLNPVIESADNLFPIDLNNDGTREFYFRWDDFEVFGNESWFVHFCANPVSDPSRQFMLIPGNYHNLLVSGTPINASASWASNWDPTIDDSFVNHFQGLGDRYLAFKAVISGTTYYGWVLIAFANKTLTIKEYAYTTNTAGLTAGQGGSLGLTENSIGQVVLSPNPVGNILVIDNKDKAQPLFSYQILDMGGKTISEGKSSYGEAITTDNIPCGNYLIRVDNDGITFTKKFIKL
ncbi:MAG: T9SS type A sorting domain-containing protein [Flavobacterium sp. JAD_PAG50586_2]|nr:MAG: T9SS type A sorting domain-containing protein [Flavobacterium sp. JAD_PAG50586_2]